MLSTAQRNLPLNLKDINNHLYRKGRVDRMGHSASEAIITKLGNDGALFRSFVDGEGRLVGLLYTTPTARRLCQAFSTVLLADCTYKTNKYKLPCFHIVGFTASKSNFTAAVVFIQQETADWYQRALNAFNEIMGSLPIRVILTDREPALALAIQAVLPTVKQIYCLWHIEKNISTKCKSGLSNEEFTTFISDWKRWIVQAGTEEGLQEGIESLRSKYQANRQFEAIMEYIDHLLHDKERYVQVWTDKYLHLGQRNTSRAEGAHRALKDSLNQSNSDFFLVISRIQGFMRLQYTEVISKMEREHVRTSISAGRLFHTVRTSLLSVFAGYLLIMGFFV